VFLNSDSYPAPNLPDHDKSAALRSPKKRSAQSFAAIAPLFNEQRKRPDQIRWRSVSNHAPNDENPSWALLYRIPEVPPVNEVTGRRSFTIRAINTTRTKYHASQDKIVATRDG
jgi:hypothetical protein